MIPRWVTVLNQFQEESRDSGTELTILNALSV